MMAKEANDVTLSLVKSQLDRLADLLPDVKDTEHPAGRVFSDILQGFEQLSENINRQNLLLHTGTAVASALTERQIFEALFEHIRFENPCEISAFRFELVNDEPLWAELKANWQKNNTPSHPTGSRLYLPEALQARLLTSKKSIFVDDISADNRLSRLEKDSFSPSGAHSVAILPLSVREQALGAVLVYFTRPHTFSTAIKRLWLGLIDQVNISLANQQLIQEAAYHVSQIETAAEVARAASSMLDFQELLDSAVALIRDRFGLYYVGVFLVDVAKEWAVLRAGTGEAGRVQLEKKHRLKIGGESMIGWSIHNRRPRIALDVGKDAVHFQNPDLPDTRSEMALPLIHRNEVIGALTIQSVEPAAFRREDIILLQTMADQLANAFQNARLFRKFQEELAERKRVEEALQASEAKYRELVQHANSIIIRFDTEGCITFFNEFAQSFFGYAEDEIVGQNVVGTIVPEMDTAGRNLAAMIKGIIKNPDQYANNENENVRRNGERVWISWTNKAIIDNAGHISEVLCVGNDITKRKQAEETRMRLATALEAVGEAILITDINGTIQYVNPAFEEITGYSRQEAIGQNPRLLKSGKHGQQFYRDMWETLLRGEVWRSEIINKKKDGTLFNVEQTLAPIKDPTGKTINFVAVARDITERKRAEQELLKFKLGIERAVEAVFLTDVDGTITYVNPAFEKIYGYSQKESLGKTPRILKSGVLPQQAYEQFWNTLLAKETVAGEIINKTKAGQLLNIEGSANPVLDENGNIIGFLAIQYDVTERYHSEQMLQEALRRTQLLYNISEVLATLTDQQAALDTVLGEYLLLLSLDRGGIMLFDQASGYNRVQALYIDNKVAELALAFPVAEDLIAQYLIKHKTSLVIDDVSTHPLTKHNQETRGPVESMLLVPLIIKGEVIGILGADAVEKGRTFTQDDIEMGEAIADQLAIWLENSHLLEEAQHRSNLLQTAAEVSKAASSILDVDQLIHTSVNYIRDQFDFYYVGLFLVDEAQKWAVLRAGTGEAGRIQVSKGHRLKIGGESMIGWSVQHRQARIALDVGEDAVHFQNPELPDTHSEMALPLISRDKVIGALTVQSTMRGAFSNEDITVLQTMADQLANAIANARLFKDVLRSQKTAEVLLQETQALQQFSQALAGTLEINKILDLFFQACKDEIGFEYVQFSLVDQYQHRVKAIAGIGLPESQIRRSNRSLDSDDIMVDIIRTGQTEVITGWDDRFDKETFEAEGHADWVRVFTPIVLRQENIGLVEAGFNKHTRAKIKDSQIRLLRAFIDQTALALDNAQRFEASQSAARREALIKEITTKVRASTNLESILQTAVQEVGDAIGSKKAYIHLVSPADSETENNN